MSEALRHTLISFSCLFVVTSAWYRVQSQRSGESLDRSKEGWPILIGLRFLGLLTMGTAVAWLYNPEWFEAVALPAPETVRWAGATGFVCALVWLVWMFHSLGRNLTDTVVTRRNATFVDDGPY